MPVKVHPLSIWCRSAIAALWPVILAAIALLSGCRTARDNHLEILERELRTQEDYIYELEDYIVEYSEKLRQCRCTHPHDSIVFSDSKKLEPDLAEEQPPRKRRSRSRRSREDEQDLAQPEDSKETDSSSPPATPEDMDIPKDLDLEFDNPLSQDRSGGAVKEIPAASFQQIRAVRVGNDVIPDPVDFQKQLEAQQVAAVSFEQAQDSGDGDQDSEVDSDPPEPLVLDRTPQRLEITRVLRDTTAPEQPRSLLAVVEARDIQDEPVDLEGEVSLMVMTEVEGDRPRRIKRWDFTVEETAAAWQSSKFGDGLHLELPLDGRQLKEPDLQLWVRMVGVDGQKLLTQVSFDPESLLAVDSTVPPGELGEPPTKALAEEGNLGSHGNQARQESPRWRASMERSDTPARGFSTTSPTQGGWTSQPPGGRLLGRPPAVAVRPPGTSRKATTKSSGEGVQQAGHVGGSGRWVVGSGQ